MTAFAVALAFYPAFAVPTATWQPSRSKQADVPGLVAEVTKTRAVVLIPGLQLHLLRPEKCRAPEQHDWQRPHSKLVKELAPDFDVYALGYTQCQPLDAVSLSFGLRSTVAALAKAGYREIVLVGHSAGGIIARQFVERFPKSGVTKVIQVAAPNAGSDYATIGIGIPKTQLPFIRSLAPEYRVSASPSTLTCAIATGLRLPRLPGRESAERHDRGFRKPVAAGVAKPGRPGRARRVVPQRGREGGRPGEGDRPPREGKTRPVVVRTNRDGEADPLQRDAEQGEGVGDSAAVMSWHFRAGG